MKNIFINIWTQNLTFWWPFYAPKHQLFGKFWQSNYICFFHKKKLKRFRWFVKSLDNKKKMFEHPTNILNTNLDRLKTRNFIWRWQESVMATLPGSFCDVLIVHHYGANSHNVLSTVFYLHPCITNNKGLGYHFSDPRKVKGHGR